MLRRDLLALAAAGLAAPSVPRAQAVWPEGPARIIVPWPPGGTTDAIARIMQPPLAEALAKPVVIENRAGAAGAVGAMEAARAAPDGNTWMLAFDTEATNQTARRLPYRVMQAFAPTTLIAAGPLAVLAHPSAPWRSVAELAGAARRAPDTIGYATAGIGTVAHVATTLMQQIGNFRLTHVPFRGGGAATEAALAGEVPLYVAPIPTAKGHVGAGALRALAVTSDGPSRHLPGVASLAGQQGFAGFEALTWWALLGRAGTPDATIRGMADAMDRVLASPEVRDAIEAHGADVVAGGPERCRRFLSAEVTKWGRVIRENNIAVEG